MRLLVTGGAGFIGSNFVNLCLSESESLFEKITVVDSLTYSGNLNNLNKSKTHSKFEFVKADICNSRLMDRVVSGHQAIVNFAAESHVDRSIQSRHEFVSTNIVGVQVLLDAALKNGVDKFIQISTDEVYGSIQLGSADENFLLEPNSPYASSKAAADLLVRSYVHTFGLNACITRSSNNFGPYQHPEKLIPRIITNLILGLKIPIYGDGGNIRDWLSVDDNCRGILSVLVSGVGGEIYNIGGNNEITNLEIAKMILSRMNKSVSEIEFVADRLGHDFRYSVSSKKISSQLNFTPNENFHASLISVIEWYKANRSWWEKLLR
jgi:dTDP-glucose 4,6-dehydratase